jgi:DNA-binding transcriptional ArsR family regulator
MGQAIRAMQVVERGEDAAVLLEPTRLKLMGELREPTSAAELARKTGEPRQRINYHLKELERVGLVKLVEERRKGNCVERVVQATASAYIVSPSVLGALGGDSASVRDRFSSAYLIAVAAESVREVATLREKAEQAGMQVPTLSVQTAVRVSSPEQLSALGAELAEAVAKIAAKYHDERAADGRVFKVNLASYPAITRDLDAAGPEPTAASSQMSTSAEPGGRKPSDLLKGD